MLSEDKARMDGDRRRAATTKPRISVLRQFLNVLGCALAIPVYYLQTAHSRYPITLDILVTIALAELNRYVVEGRRMAFGFRGGKQGEERPGPQEKDDWDGIHLESQPRVSRLECLAAVVGWREDPSLYRRALESYKSAKTCAFVLAGIDGDEAEDQDMVRIFNQVFPEQSAVVQVPEPLGEVAERIRSKTISLKKQYGQPIDEAEIDAIVMQYCIDLAKSILSQHRLRIGAPDGVRQLCLKQRHLHKKGIMFTSFVFSLVIADILGIEFMWSSDSDTIVFSDSLERTINAIAADHQAGGASSGLVVHNAHETPVTQLASAVYWGELYLTRSTPACTGTSDCQSGPSTAFRLTALPEILVPWYLQKALGKRMIVNEDRHLTTNLLLRGWKVIFASDVLTATDTPTTMARWLKQQVRWARATHIESLLHPRVYTTSHPLLFYGMVKREFGPAIGAMAIIWYFFTSQQLLVLSHTDLLFRILLGTAYNLLRNPHRLTRNELAWIIPGILFYYIPLPAVQVWSMLTMAADGWGTSMRASGEQARRDSWRKAWWETGFFIAWMGILAGCVAKLLAIYLCLVWHEKMAAILVFMGIASFGAWKITIGAS
ncbi:Glycosyltransferase 2-like domain-containing protein [Madurella fahalii]|uniref:Glycosyltransferase 2-like domain-containing protein n=1 Tax=Madurella fahalii TaxID=1157608 RepID=A0ABQ0GGH5_9PEZI